MKEACSDAGTLLIPLSGELDHCRSNLIREEIERKILHSPKAETLLLDFSQVSFMDSSGVGMIIGRYKTMKKRGGNVCAQNLRPHVDKMFHLAGLHRIIRILPKQEENA